MKKHLIISLALALFVALPALATPKAAYIWTYLKDGLHYTTYSFSTGEKQHTEIHAFRIDPKRYKLDVVVAKDEKLGATAEQLSRENGALIVVNGGFFTPEHKSIGLIVKDGKRINPLHRTSWWSVFAIRNDEPIIMRPKEFKLTKDIQMALQVGPRLVINKTIPRLKDGSAIRSAVGISSDGMVIIAITSGSGISLNELARRMKNSRWQGGLECDNAMGLDGGSSSQIYAKIKNFEYSQPGLVRVTNGLAVLSK